MEKKRPYVFFEKSHLSYAEQSLHTIRESDEYQQYRRGLEQVENLEQRYTLANQFKDVLRAEYELEHAISESILEIEGMERESSKE